MTTKTITPLPHRAVQNKQVCGIVCDYKQIFRDNEPIYALLPSSLKHLHYCLRDQAFACLVIE